MARRQNSEGSIQDYPLQSDSVSALIILAASMGGIQALTHVLAQLPSDFPAAVCVVQHLSADFVSTLPEVLSRVTSLTVKPAEDGDRLQNSIVYVAPSGYHLVIKKNGILSLSSSEKVQFVRPSADRLLESAATVFTNRVIAAILTGTGSDGAKGIQTVKAYGGTVIAQNEATSQSFGMPGAAIQTGSVDYILPLTEIAPMLQSLVEGDRD